MELTFDLILVIASSVILLFALMYILYYFKNLNHHVEPEKKVSNANNYSGANFHAEYKFDGKYKKNEYITSSKIIFFVLIFMGYLYFQYYQDGFDYSNSRNSRNSSYGMGVEDISLSNITLFGSAANSLSGNTSSRSNYGRSNYGRSNYRRSRVPRRTIRGSGSSFRTRSYSGGK